MLHSTHRCRVSIAALVLATAGATASAHEPPFLPPHATPHGISLADMAGAIALFTTSFNDPAQAPTGAITLTSPFQVLYQDPANATFVASGGGVTVIASNRFQVRPGTTFYLPIWNADDSPPIVPCPASLCGGEPFPVDRHQALGYFFDPTAAGGDFEVVIDGRVHPVSHRYVAGPVTTPPLLDGGGTHIITVGVFVRPLEPGRHTVEIRGGVYGQAIAPVYGIDFFAQDVTDTVDVVGER